jgi:AcrR family transcriptional regulator
LNLSDSGLSNGAELDRQERLLLIAAKFFLDKGYSATSIDEIAEAAGTTGPALYRLFDNKQDILDRLCLTGMEMRLQGIQDAIDKGCGDPRETLRHLVRARIDFAFGAWGYQAPITLAEYKHLSPAAVRKVDTASEIGMSEWLRCLVQIRPETPTRELLSIIYAVLMEISYVALYIDELDIDQDARAVLERLALAGLTSGY